jgi:transposase
MPRHVAGSKRVVDSATFSTHVLAAIGGLSRLECVAETLRHALNVLATVEPTWLQAWVPSEWFERYATRWEDYRLPSGREERQALAEMIGRDGRRLLQHIYATASPTWLRELPAITILRQVWIQQFYAEEEQAHWRDAKDLPPSSLLICTPYDAEARYSQKRGMSWTGDIRPYDREL